MDLHTNIAPLHQQGDTATLAEHHQAMYKLLAEFDRVCKALDIKYFLFAGTLLGAVRHKGFIPWDDDLDVIMLRADYERFMRQAPAVLDKDRFYLQAEFTEHWPMFFSKLRLNGTACLEKYHPKDPQCHEGVYIDLFPCDNAFDSSLLRKLQFACSKLVIAKGLARRGYDTDSAKKKLLLALCSHMPMGLVHRFVRGPKSCGKYLHSFLGGASKFSRSVYPAECFAESEQLAFEDGCFPVPVQRDTLLTILYSDYMSLPTAEERRVKEHCFLVDLKRSYEHYEHYRDDMKFDAPVRSIR